MRMRKFSDIESKKINENTDLMIPEPKNELQEEPKQVEATEANESTDVVKFFSKLFESKEMAHIFHLQVKSEEGSFATHEALGEYYENVLDIIDEIVEVYQGQYDIVEGYEIIDTNETKNYNPVEYFKELGEFILTNRTCINERDTHILSLVDDLLNLLYKTVYKLKFLK